MSRAYAVIVRHTTIEKKIVYAESDGDAWVEVENDIDGEFSGSEVIETDSEIVDVRTAD